MAVLAPGTAALRRLLHPARTRRMGEASHPGPGSTSATSTSDTSSDESSSSALPQPASQPLAQADGLTLPKVQLRIRMASGRPATLKCQRLPKLGSWKWATSKFAHQGRTTPGQVLRQWATKFAEEIAPEGLAENLIESALALHPDPPPPPVGPLVLLWPTIRFLIPSDAGPLRPRPKISPPPGELERCRSVSG